MLELVLQSGAGLAFVEAGIGEFFDDPAGVTMGVILWGLLLGGSLLMLLASVGLIRLPDLPTRMHASTKAGSLGAALIMLAVAVAMPSPDVWARSIAVIAFLLLTAPVAAHVIGRAGYFVGVPLWEGTVKDELAEKYDYGHHTLESGSLGEREIDGFEEDGLQESDKNNGEEEDIGEAWSESDEEVKEERKDGDHTDEEASEDDGDKALVSTDDDEPEASEQDAEAVDDQAKGSEEELEEEPEASEEDDTEEQAGASEEDDTEEEPEVSEEDGQTSDDPEEEAEESAESDDDEENDDDDSSEKKKDKVEAVEA